MPAESSHATGHGLVLVPQPPCVRSIFFSEQPNKAVRLVFPYTLFGMFYFRDGNYQYRLKRLHVIFGQQEFTGVNPEEKFYGLPIRNHDGAFATCFYAWPGEQTLEKFAHLIINQYWMSPYAEYNDWASWWTQRYASRNPKFFSRWLEATKKKDYKFIFNEELLAPDHHVNLGKLLEANKSHYAAGGIEVCNLVTPAVEGLEQVL